jgi:NitT/TauT family transport system permease protein
MTVFRQTARLRRVFTPRRLSAFGLSAAGLVLLAAAEEALARLGVVSSEYLPPATTILARLVQLLGNVPFLADLRDTTVSALVGLLIAVPAGLFLGLLFGLVRPAYTAVRVIVDLLRPVPAVAIVPLLVLVVGISRASVVCTVVAAVIWPVLLNTVHGVRDVDSVALQTARMFGAGRGRRLAEVVIPSAALSIAAGIRVATGLALVIAVAGELLIGTESGIGSYILVASQGGGHTDYVYAAVCAAGLLGLAVNWAAQRLERLVLPWTVGVDR